ncbi:sister chromatid cohesion protein SCC2 isoform X2, partial [Tanacetum coccineum]
MVKDYAMRNKAKQQTELEAWNSKVREVRDFASSAQNFFVILKVWLEGWNCQIWACFDLSCEGSDGADSTSDKAILASVDVGICMTVEGWNFVNEQWRVTYKAPAGMSLVNTVHSEIAPCFPFPSLPVFCGALDHDLRFIDQSSNKSHLVISDQADKIAKLLHQTDVSYFEKQLSWLSAEVAIYLSIFITVLSHLCSMLPFTDDEDDDYDEEFGSASKRRRRSVKVKKSNKYSASQIVASLSCEDMFFNFTGLRFIDDSNAIIEQIFYSYTQHRVYVMDELLHLLMKLPFSKRIPRTYHLADDEQRQIQMITALLIQLIHCSGNLPSSLREAPDNNPLFNIGIDSSYPLKSQEAVTEACCLFWSRVLQRFANTKNQNQDASEFKIMLENLVIDLLATLNLPEYPASAHILEVLCVLLLQNAGLKSKDVTARSIAIDVLGTVAARLKRDAVLCKKEKFWIVQELLNEDDMDYCPPDDACSVCLDSRVEKPLVLCEGCQRLSHIDCLGIRDNEVSGSSWLCPLCLCRKQLLFLQSYCKAQGGGEGNHTRKKSKSSDAVDITKMEIVQQMLLNYLQDSGSAEDVHMFTRWSGALSSFSSIYVSGTKMIPVVKESFSITLPGLKLEQ